MFRIISVFAVIGLLLFCSTVSAGEAYHRIKFSSCQTGGSTAWYYADNLEDASVGAANGCFVVNGAPFTRVVGDCLRNKNNACTSGYSYGTGSCAGENVIAEDGRSCEEPPPPCEGPNCSECVLDGAPVDWLQLGFDYEGHVVVTDEVLCGKYITDQEQQECRNPLGTFNGVLICEDEQIECTMGGGTFGLWDGEAVCLPDDYADELPTCDAEGVVHLIEGGFVCESPTPIDDSTPGQNDPNDPAVDDQFPDQDGDGIPDKDDPDIDGDGIPNGQDDDTDGDGIDDVDDITPDGEGENSEVSGGGSCTSRPSCSGDAIQCAILYQTWAARCNSDNTEQVGTNDAENLQSANDSVADGLVDAFGTALSDSIGDGDAGIAGPGGLSADLLSGFLDVGACSDMSFVWLGNTVAIPCSKTQTMRDILAWVVSLYTLFAVFSIATRPVVAKG